MHIAYDFLKKDVIHLNFKKSIMFLVASLLFIAVPVFAVEKGQQDETDSDKDAPYKSEDYKMFASISEDMVMNKSLTGDPEIMGEDGFGFRIPSLLRAVTPDKDDVLLAMSHVGNDSADWGNLNIGMRRSLDNGKTWSNVDKILNMPVRDAPQDFDDWGAAFYIDPVPVQADNGDIILMLDMFPESKGLHAAHWLEDGNGHTTIDGEDYLVLYDGDSKVGDKQTTNPGNTYTVREDGWIYDSDHQKTNYYIPQHHSAEHQYQTMGDMYYAVGEPDFISKSPPLVPNDSSEDSSDIYVGNIYLNYDKPDFKPDNPDFVQKRFVGPEKNGDDYSKYAEVETDPAPLRAAVTSHLWVTKSSDMGETWSQPVDITAQVKIPEDGAFLGLGPGTGLNLTHQEETKKDSRLLMPVYALGKGGAIYSDDDGDTWNRATSSHEGYINNIDEIQFIELYDGTVMSLGRQQGKGDTPVSISKDGGETWSEQFHNKLQSVQVQKSTITYPMNSSSTKDHYVPGMKKDKQYVISSHPTGEPNDASRTNGVVELGEVQEDGDIIWVAQRSLKSSPNPYADTQGYENFFAYSSLAVLEDGNIGVLFEPQPNNYIAFSEFNLEWVNEGSNSALILKRLADYDDAFSSQDAYRKVELHLKSLQHYEDEEKVEKVVKHLNSLNELINYQKEHDMISEEAYKLLTVNTDYLKEKWQHKLN